MTNTDTPETLESLCFQLRKMADDAMMQIDADRLCRAADALTALQADNAALKARAEAAEAALARAYMAGRDDAAKALDTCGDSAVTEAMGQKLCCSGYHCGCGGSNVGAFLMHYIRALPMPADLAKRVGVSHE